MARRWTWLCAAGLASAWLGAGCGGSDEDLGLGKGPTGTGGSGAATGVGGSSTTTASGGSGSGNGGSSGSGGSGSGNGGSGGSGGSGSGSGSGSSSSGGSGDAAVVDLRADVNRNGTIDLTDPTEDEAEDTWDGQHGAIFLANVDDDQKACPSSGQNDAAYAACNDAADDVVNGADDLEDLARLMTVPWPAAYADAVGSISVSAPDRVRLFKKSTSGAFEPFDPQATKLDAKNLAEGIELAIEARDILRDAALWDGFVDVRLTVTGTSPSGTPMPETTDVVRMRVAPVLFRHHLDPARTVYVTKQSSSGSTALRNDLKVAAAAASLPDPVYEYSSSDQWTQDFFETAYTSMPAPGGAQHVIHVNFRSANYTSNSLRSAGRIVFALRGKDVAGLAQFDPQHSNQMDSLNSFGNLETVPPYSLGGKAYPRGRVLRGSTPSFYPDKSFDLMISSQGAQPMIYIDTEWLLVGHVDETTTFFKTSSPRGWALGLNDPALAKTMLEQAKAAGHGGTPMFVGKYWWGTQSAEVTIDEVLADPDVMNESAKAAVEIAGQLDTLVQETGLEESEILRIPFLHQPSEGYSVAYQPGTVNGIYLSDKDFAPPRPHGPVIDGEDIFEKQLVEAFAPYGINVHFIEDWDLYHRLDGEVHCGTNTTRVVPETNRWWEGGL